MKINKSWWLALIIVVAGLLAFLLVAGLCYYLSYVAPNQLAEKRVQQTPPQILVRSPRAGDSVTAGGSISAQAVITAMNPIARVEIWLDGALAATQYPDFPDQSTFQASLEVPILEGVHALYWRAVDDAGLVGQSTPISIAGVTTTGAAETASVTAAAGQDLEDIADAQGVTTGSLRHLNPGLGEGALPEGTSVTVPVPPSPDQPELPRMPVDLPPSALPNASEGTARLEAARFAFLDLGPLIPALLSNRPAAPSDFVAGFEPCTVRLIWTDNASNERGFEVWMQALGGPPVKLSTTAENPGTGQTMYEFPSPTFGIYGFWVEAFNALGSQPSTIQWLAVNDASCGAGTPPQLLIDPMMVTGYMSGGWHDVYCFVSLEAAPYQRLPEDDSQFLQWDTWLADRNLLLIPAPADEELTVSGDCWGWRGALPESMGTFSTSVPKAQWDNRTLTSGGREFVFSYRIRPFPFGVSGAEGTFTYIDASILKPQDVSITALEPIADRVQNAIRARQPTLHWTWNGDPGGITGFIVELDGAAVSRIMTPTARQHDLFLPSTCGGTYEIRVAAISGAGRSTFSDSVEYRQPPCKAYVRVQIWTYTFTWIKPEDKWSPDCDTAQISTHVVVDDLYRGFAGTETTCGVEYRLTDLKLADHRGPVADLATFDVPLDPQNPYVQIKVTWWKPDNVFVAFYDETIALAGLGEGRTEFSGSEDRVSGSATVNYTVDTYEAPE